MCGGKEFEFIKTFLKTLECLQSRKYYRPYFFSKDLCNCMNNFPFIDMNKKRQDHTTYNSNCNTKLSVCTTLP